VEAIKSLLPHLTGGEVMLAALEGDGTLKLTQAMPGLKERAKTLVELIENAGYLFAKRPLSMDEKAEKLLDEAGRETLAELKPRLDGLDDWSAEALEACVRSFADDTERKLGKVAQPLRAALTGTSTSPGIFDVLVVLGREESLGRIGDQTV
jgi:glutamyl-tRNA synthetase